jgi:hypothetical protein
MELLTKEIEATLPGLYAQDDLGDNAIAYVKFFDPTSQWTWFASEYDPADKLFFGLVVGMETELGYFSLEELQAWPGRLGLKIERDLYWTPKPLKECV